MKTFKRMIADSVAKIILSSVKRKSTILKEVIDNPENIQIEAKVDGGEIVVKIKKKEF